MEPLTIITMACFDCKWISRERERSYTIVSFQIDYVNLFSHGVTYSFHTNNYIAISCPIHPSSGCTKRAVESTILVLFRFPLL